jgi:hypothetical protein
MGRCAGPPAQHTSALETRGRIIEYFSLDNGSSFKAAYVAKRICGRRVRLVRKLNGPFVHQRYVKSAHIGFMRISPRTKLDLKGFNWSRLICERADRCWLQCVYSKSNAATGAVLMGPRGRWNMAGCRPKLSEPSNHSTLRTGVRGHQVDS